MISWVVGVLLAIQSDVPTMPVPGANACTVVLAPGEATPSATKFGDAVVGKGTPKFQFLKSGYTLIQAEGREPIAISPEIRQVRHLLRIEAALKDLRVPKATGLQKLSQLGEGVVAYVGTFLSEGLLNYSEPLPRDTNCLFEVGNLVNLTSAGKTANVKFETNAYGGLSREEGDKVQKELFSGAVSPAFSEKEVRERLKRDEAAHKSIGGRNGVNVRVYGENFRSGNRSQRYIQGINALEECLDVLKARVQQELDKATKRMTSSLDKITLKAKDGASFSELDENAQKNLKRRLFSMRADFGLSTQEDVDEFLSQATLASQRPFFAIYLPLSPGGSLLTIRLTP